MMDVRMLSKVLLQHFLGTQLSAAQRQIEHIGNLHVREVVVHVMAESHLTVVLLLADHLSVLGLSHQHHLFLIARKHHQHLGCKVARAERILSDRRREDAESGI